MRRFCDMESKKFINFRDERTARQKAQFEWFSNSGTIARTRQNLRDLMNTNHAWFSSQQFQEAEIIFKRLEEATKSKWETAKILYPSKKKAASS
jgi:hypothetical protein